MTERTSHDQWDEQALHDCTEAAGALLNLATTFDGEMTSWDGIEPATAIERLREIDAAVQFALAAAIGARVNTGVSGS